MGLLHGWAGALVVLAAVPSLAGEVRGRVGYAGPEVPAARLPATKDLQACGASVPDESLLVSRGGLANAVVTLQGPPPAPPSKVALEQRACRYVPHVQVVPVGSTLEIVNADPVLHNVHGWLGRTTRFNVPTPEKGMRVPVTLDRPGVIQVLCDVHGWMSAYVAVADGPAAVTGAEGTFAIRDIPAGSYRLTAWHERLGTRIAEVTVPAEGAAWVELTFEPR